MKAHEIKWNRKTKIDVSPITYECRLLDKIKDKPLTYAGFKIDDTNIWKGRATKVLLECDFHGSITMQLSSILRGSGCKKCGTEIAKIKTRKTQEQFINEVIEKHNNTLDLSDINYINDTTKVEVKCIKHNFKFSISPTHLLSGRSCKLCKNDKLSTLFIGNTKQFIVDAEKKHPNKFLYDKVLYKKSNVKVEIFCNNHKDYFLITPNKLLQGGGCPKCASHGYNQTKPGYFYIQILSQNENELYIKFGITNNTPQSRMKQQQYTSSFSHKLLESLKFKDGSIPVKIESEIKNNLQCGTISKQQLGDGFTETISIKYIHSILTILEKYKGLNL